jgi:hypothetical protein
MWVEVTRPKGFCMRFPQKECIELQAFVWMHPLHFGEAPLLTSKLGLAYSLGWQGVVHWLT